MATRMQLTLTALLFFVVFVNSLSDVDDDEEDFEHVSLNYHTQTRKPTSPSPAERSRDGTKALSVNISRVTDLLTEMGYLPGWVSESSPLFVSSLKSFQADYGLSSTGFVDDATLSFLSKGRCSYPGVLQHRPFSLKKVYKYRLNGCASKLGYAKTGVVWREAVNLVSNFSQGVTFQEASPSECADIEVFFVVGPLHIRNIFFSGEKQEGTLAYVDSNWYKRGDEFQVGHYLYVDYEKCWQEATREDLCFANLFRPSLLITFVHELGHVLGIEHVKNPTSIMFPFSMDDGRFANRSIPESDKKLFYDHVHANDIVNESYVQHKAEPVPVTRKPTPAPVTPRKAKPIGEPISLNLCEGNFSGFHTLDDFVYIVKNEYVWILDPATLELVSTQPTHIQLLWPNYVHPGITCMFRDFEGRLKLVYKKEVFDFSLKRNATTEKAVQYCFQTKNRILAFKEDKFIVLEQRQQPERAADSLDLNASKRSRWAKDPYSTYADEMDYIMRNDSMFFFFKEDKLWMNETFKAAGKVANVNAMRIVDFWLPKYCTTDDNSSTAQLLKLSSLSREISALADSLFLGKKSLLSVT